MVKTETVHEETPANLNGLKDLAKHSGPCISIYLPLDNAVTNGQVGVSRLKNAIQELTRKLPDNAETQSLLAPLRQLAEAGGRDTRLAGLAIFRSPGFMKIIPCDVPFSEGAYLDDCFYVRPVLGTFAEPILFDLLALSRKNVRLLRCSFNECQHLRLPESMPTSVAGLGAFDQPDHDLENQSSDGPSRGTPGRIHFGTGADREQAYLHNFFKSVDRELRPLLVREGLPLVVAAVREELAEYTKANTYSGLLSTGIAMSPERVSDLELQKLGIEILKEHFAESRRKAVEQFAQLVGTARLATGIEACLKAARGGHVVRLLLPDSASQNEPDLNRIALETIKRSGRVFLAAAREIPGGAPVAAMLRH